MRKMYFMLMALAFVGLSLSFSSCSDSGDDGDNPPPSSKELTVTVNPTTIADFTSVGEMQTVNVKVEPENTEWSVVVAEDWATIDRTGNKFTIKPSENTGEDRTNSVTITVKGLEPVVMPFKQKAVAKTLDISGTFDYTASGGAKTLTINSNTAWTVTTTYNEGTGWLTYSVASGTGNGTVTVTAAANTAAARTAVIKVQATQDASLFKTVNVTQAAKSTVFIDDLVGAWTLKGIFLQQNPTTKEWKAFDNTHEVTITKVNATTIKIDGIMIFEEGATFHNAINATVDNTNKTVTIAQQKFYGGTGSFDEDGWDVYFTPYTKELKAGYHELWGESFKNIPVTGTSGSYSIDLTTTVFWGDVGSSKAYYSYLPLTIAPGSPTPPTTGVYWYSQVVANAVFVQGAPPASAPAIKKEALKAEVSPAFEKMMKVQRTK